MTDATDDETTTTELMAAVRHVDLAEGRAGWGDQGLHRKLLADPFDPWPATGAALSGSVDL